MNKRLGLPRIIVVGSEGRLGRKLVSNLIDQFDVIGIDLPGKRRALADSNLYQHFDCDITNLGEVDRLLRLVNSPIQGIVFTTRLKIRSDLRCISLAEILSEIAVSVGGLLHFCQSLLANNSKQKGEIFNIVVISSILSSKISKVEGVGYHISKAAQDQFVRYLAHDLAKEGVRVNAIAPALIYEDKVMDEDGKRIYEIVKLVHSGKVPPNVDNLCAIVKFLIGADSEGISGQIIRLDGGSQNTEASYIPLRVSRS